MAADTTPPPAAAVLVARLAQGDDAAFRQLYDEYAGRLRRFLLVLSRGDETLCDDVLQQTFLTAAAKLRAVDDEQHLWHWLARVARQHLAKAWRRRRREGSPLSLSDVPEPAEETAAEDALDLALGRARQKLANDEAALLQMFYDERLSQRDMAERLAATPKAVANRLDRVREKLRRLIHEELRRENR